jgi:hypothetical protein
MEILGKKISDIGYFINLPESIDRLNNVNSQIEKYSIKNLIRFEALTDPWHQTSCTKSHRGVFELAKQNGYDVIYFWENYLNSVNGLKEVKIKMKKYGNCKN